MPQSVVVRETDWSGLFDRGIFPGEFTYRFLAEGDSWMDRSALVKGALPDHLGEAFDAAGESAFILNLAIFGDTMRRIGEVLTRKHGFGFWLDQLTYDAILFSAGGNDFIDAACDPPTGTGLLHDFTGKPQPPRGRDCVRRQAVTDLVTKYLNKNFAAVYDLVRTSQGANVPIFLNSYDTPVARDAPATGKPWLYRAYRQHGIAEPLWPDLTESLFNDIQATINGWTKRRQQVIAVPTRGVLSPASASSKGVSGDWQNEIHPNDAGWTKLASVWHATMKLVI